jgi:hypothetical protein
VNKESGISAIAGNGRKRKKTNTKMICFISFGVDGFLWRLQKYKKSNLRNE